MERTPVLPGDLQPVIIARFFARIDIADCWEWTGPLNRKGYGVASLSRSFRGLPHRLVWQLLVGEIPPGMTLDHRCENRRCVNPDHLEVVTRGENVRRIRWGGAQIMAARTHCPSNHPYDAENTRRDSNGHRLCIVCRRVGNARRERLRRRGVATPSVDLGTSAFSERRSTG